MFKDKVFSHWDLLNRLAEKRFSRGNLAEAAVLYAVNCLAENDWERIRKFNGKSKFTTYLTSVVFRLFEDFSRKQFGRKKIPQWILAMGGVWLILFRLLCFERFPYNDAVLIAVDRRPDVDPQQIEVAAEKILGEVPGCAEVQYEETTYQDDSLTDRDNNKLSRQQKNLEQKQKEQIVQAVLVELLGDSGDSGDSGDAVTKTLIRNSFRLNFEITAEERLLLKLHHLDGVAVSEAGRMIGLNRYQVHGKMRRLYARIRQVFIDNGHENEIRLLFWE